MGYMQKHTPPGPYINTYIIGLYIYVRTPYGLYTSMYTTGTIYQYAHHRDYLYITHI